MMTIYFAWHFQLTCLCHITFTLQVCHHCLILVHQAGHLHAAVTKMVEFHLVLLAEVGY